VKIAVLVAICLIPLFTVPAFAPSHPEYVGVDLPGKQIANGAAPHEVICSEGLELIFKATNGFPACVKPSTATKLVERGWGISFVVNLRATGTTGLTGLTGTTGTTGTTGAIVTPGSTGF